MPDPVDMVAGSRNLPTSASEFFIAAFSRAIKALFTI
jgi:hypothetical protein